MTSTRTTRDSSASERPASRLVVAVACLAAVLAVAACAESGPVQVSMERLSADQETYHERLVKTQGVVVAIDEYGGQPHHVLEDERSNRVQLVPDKRAARYAGRNVTVVGRFRFEPNRGRQLTVQTIEWRGGAIVTPPSTS